MSNGRKFRRNIESVSLFEHEMSVSELMKLGNPLEYLDKIVDFEVFRPTLEDACEQQPKEQRRPPPS